VAPIQVSFNIINSDKTAKDYDIRPSKSATVLITDSYRPKILDIYSDIQFFETGTAKTSVYTVRINAGETKTIKAEITPSRSMSGRELYLFSGMIAVQPKTPNNGRPSNYDYPMSVPFAGLFGTAFIDPTFFIKYTADPSYQQLRPGYTYTSTGLDRIFVSIEVRTPVLFDIYVQNAKKGRIELRNYGTSVLDKVSLCGGQTLFDEGQPCDLIPGQYTVKLLLPHIGAFGRLMQVMEVSFRIR
jgi:hypothetical protein